MWRDRSRSPPPFRELQSPNDLEEGAEDEVEEPTEEIPPTDQPSLLHSKWTGAEGPIEERVEEIARGVVGDLGALHLQLLHQAQQISALEAQIKSLEFQVAALDTQVLLESIIGCHLRCMLPLLRFCGCNALYMLSARCCS